MGTCAAHMGYVYNAHGAQMQRAWGEHIWHIWDTCVARVSAHMVHTWGTCILDPTYEASAKVAKSSTRFLPRKGARGGHARTANLSASEGSDVRPFKRVGLDALKMRKKEKGKK